MGEAAPQRAEIEAALDRLQVWPGLARSPQLAKFLRYIVEARLNGDEAGIKAYSIAVDVFGRPQSFDPQADPIVRVQARRLRAALDEYYAGDGAAESVRFYLPVGRYVPEFALPGQPSPPDSPDSPRAAVPAPPPRTAGKRSLLTQIDDIFLLVLFVVVALGLALVMTQVLAPRQVRLAVPQPPRIAVAEFISVATGSTPSPSVAGLAVELVTDLNLFPFIDAAYLPRLDETTADDDAPFELSGIARGEVDDVHVAASLRRTATDTSAWTMSQTVPSAGLADHLDDLSRGFADQLGSYAGPLHSDAVQWLMSTPDITGNETDYMCTLLYWMSRSTADPALLERTRTCVNGLLARTPKSAIGLAIRGGLLVQQIYRVPTQRDPEPVAEAERLLREALGLFPTSSFIWREYGGFLALIGRPGEAEAAFSSALQLNPADLDAVASYGVLLSQMGQSERGAQFANAAIARSISAPYWYHRATSINALRDGYNALALQEGEQLSVGDSELGSVIMAVAAYRLGNEDTLNTSIAQILEVARFRRYGIIPVLNQRLLDDDLRNMVITTLAAAGIDQAALNGPF